MDQNQLAIDWWNKHQAAIRAGEPPEDWAADSARAQADQPPMPAVTAGDPTRILQAQLAGDRFGDSRTVLQSLQNRGQVGPGFSPSERLFLPAHQRQQVEAYYPKGGFGGEPSEDAKDSTFDFDLYRDPEFQRVWARDPNRAKFVYQSITGRNFDMDSKMHNRIAEERYAIGKQYAATALKSGAKFDPRTGKWNVWNMEPPVEQGLSLTNPAATRQFVEATPEQAFWLNQYYPRIMGRDLPVLDKARITRQENFESQQTPEIRAAIEAEVTRRKQLTGMSPTETERLQIANDVLNKKPKQGVMTKIGQAFDATASAMAGYKSQPDSLGFQLPLNTQTPRNIFGRFMDFITRGDRSEYISPEDEAAYEMGLK